MTVALSDLVPAVIRNPSRVASAGSGGSWVADVESLKGSASVIRVRHYQTLMVAMLVDDPIGSVFNVPDRLRGLYLCAGWGSVSDQGGLNRIFDSVGLPIRYSRADGCFDIRSGLAVEPVIRERFDHRANPLWVAR